MLVSYTFEIDDKVKEKIERFAKEEGRSLASQIRIALENYSDIMTEKSRRKEDR